MALGILILLGVVGVLAATSAKAETGAAPGVTSSGTQANRVAAPVLPVPEIRTDIVADNRAPWQPSGPLPIIAGIINPKIDVVPVSPTSPAPSGAAAGGGGAPATDTTGTGTQIAGTTGFDSGASFKVQAPLV